MSNPAPTRPDAAAALRTAFAKADRLSTDALLVQDPWAADYGVSTLAALDAAAATLLGPLREALPGLQGPALLQQAWAVASSEPVWAALLFRLTAARGAGAGLPMAEARRLLAISQARWPKAWPRPTPVIFDVASLLLCEDPARMPVPDFGSLTRLKGSIRLRFRLAYLCSHGVTLSVLLSAAVRQPSASGYQRRVEFARAVRCAAAAGRRWRALREVELALLGRREQALLLALTPLWATLLVSRLHRRSDLRDLTEALATERERLEDLLETLVQALQVRRFGTAAGSVDSLMAELDSPPADGLVDASTQAALLTTLARRHFTESCKEEWESVLDPKSQPLKASLKSWVPMSAAALQRLSTWRGTPLPEWWALTPAETAARIAAGSLSVGLHDDAIPALDLAALRRGWSVDDQLSLIRSGHGRLVQDDAAGWSRLSLAELPAMMEGTYQHGRRHLARRLASMRDARPWLVRMKEAEAAEADGAKALRTLAETAIDENVRGVGVRSPARTWGQWVAATIGSTAWTAVRAVAMERLVLLQEAVTLLSSQRKPLAPVAFRREVAQALHLPGQLPHAAPEMALRWLELDPAATEVLARAGPLPLLQSVAGSAHTPVAVLDRLIEHGPPAVRVAAWRQRLRRASTSAELLAFTLELPPEPGPLPWSKRWFELPGAERHLALVMASRRNGWRLKGVREQLVKEFGAEGGAAAFHLALTGAESLLKPRAPREAAMLELVRTLGEDLAPPLMQVFAMADRHAAPGHKLDAAYSRYLRPKKSGGNRVISAPHRSLKQVQRAILHTLLNPLPLHDSAHGFVPGRSIRDNALVHVGQAVVVNADVSNCFPSVKWPLVLAALRKSLSTRLSPVAVSMLLDICSAEGGLPIGAPTSPALLNLVLSRTDEVLAQAAAARQVRYTRYADDLSFSGGSGGTGKSGECGAVQMLGIARRTLSQIGLQLDPKKTNIYRRGRRQIVTGLVVNTQVSVPRRIRRRLRAAVHQVEQGGQPHWHGKEQSLAALTGRVGFVTMIHPGEGAALLARLAGRAAGAGEEEGEGAGGAAQDGSEPGGAE